MRHAGRAVVPHTRLGAKELRRQPKRKVLPLLGLPSRKRLGSSRSATTASMALGWDARRVRRATPKFRVVLADRRTANRSSTLKATSELSFARTSRNGGLTLQAQRLNSTENKSSPSDTCFKF